MSPHVLVYVYYSGALTATRRVPEHRLHLFAPLHHEPWRHRACCEVREAREACRVEMQRGLELYGAGRCRTQWS